MASDHPYSSFLHKVLKPGQYIGGEQGAAKKDWDAVSGRMCLAFPDLYEIGMSHLGYKILYDILNKHPKLLAERAYAPWGDMEKELRSRGEKLRSLESWRPLSDFDVVGFSLQFELTYSNILLMLDLGGIPRFSSDRKDDDPLIVAGGPTATHAEPMADFIDVFLIGDGEEKTPELVLAWQALREAGVPRQERLVAISKLGGFYVPSLYEVEEQEDTGFRVVAGPKDDTVPYPVQRAIVRDLSKYPFPSDGPVANTETIFDRVSVEIARGCTEGCRFCQAGMIYRPVRERPPEQIISVIKDTVREGGYDEASLTSLSTADYSAIQPLVHEVMEAVKDDRVNVSVSSLRAYGLSENVLDDMKTQRAGGLTFAPEAGTQRMRDVINKNVTEEQLMVTAERIFSRGWTKMKLYFMIGLPTEEDEDVLGIVETGRRAQAVGRRVRGRNDIKVTVSVSTHVPKPHTPFQWVAMNSYDEVQRKQRLLKHAAKNARVVLRMHDSHGSWLEGVLARGDRRLSAVISDAYDAGARFDSWDERLHQDAWANAFKAHNVDTNMFLGTIPANARLPWDHIDVGLEQGFLAREYRKALKNRLSPPCGKVAGSFVHHTNIASAEAEKKRLVCYDCGIACDMTQMKEERLVFLGTLGAKTEPKPPPVPEPELVDKTKNVDIGKKNAPRRGTNQGEGVRVRLAFRKFGRATFTSHLDLVRLFPRLFRRAQLPVFYSEGFHARPVMVFCPALTLGASSLSEYVDVKFRRRDVSDEVLQNLPKLLAPLSFDGIEFTGATVLSHGDKTIASILQETEFVAGVARMSLPDSLQNESALKSRAAERLKNGVSVVRQAKGLYVQGAANPLGKKINVSDALSEFVVGEGQEAIDTCGIVGDLIPVRFVLKRNWTGKTPRPSEVLRGLLSDTGAEAIEARLIRARMWAHVDGVRVDPLDLATLRDGQKKARAKRKLDAEPVLTLNIPPS